MTIQERLRERLTLKLIDPRIENMVIVLLCYCLHRAGALTKRAAWKSVERVWKLFGPNIRRYVASERNDHNWQFLLQTQSCSRGRSNSTYPFCLFSYDRHLTHVTRLVSCCQHCCTNSKVDYENHTRVKPEPKPSWAMSQPYFPQAPNSYSWPPAGNSWFCKVLEQPSHFLTSDDVSTVYWHERQGILRPVTIFLAFTATQNHDSASCPRHQCHFIIPMCTLQFSSRYYSDQA